MAIYPPGKTEQDVQDVYTQAYKKTQIHYTHKTDKNTGFLAHRLKNLNHVSPHQNSVKKNLLVRLIDSLYNVFMAVYSSIVALIKKLYPRRAKIYGYKKDAYITGKLTFAREADIYTPIHNMDVEFWARKRLGGWRKMAEGYTDKDGVIMLEFDFIESRKFKYKSFHFEIHQTSHVFFNNSGQAIKKCELFERIKVKKSALTGLGYDLGDIQLFYWEYRTDSLLPRVVIKDHDKDAPEYYSAGRNRAIEEQFVAVELVKDKHLIEIKFHPERLSIPKIQADYPLNLTVAMEDSLKGSTRCDYWFGRRMMNAMNCATFMPDKEDSSLYWVKYYGSCDYKVNNEYAFPTVECQFKIAENGLPLPVKIKVTGQVNAINKDPFQVVEYTPKDGDKWEQAKRVMRVSGALSTEIDDHFAGTHLNTEQFAVAARRNIRKNPVSDLLLPHLKEVALINHTADTILIGPGYIPKASAMTAEAIIERATDALGAHDWKGWTPMKIISEKHYYAKAQHLFWGIVNEYVDQFFEQNEAAIKEEWYEIYCFSEDLYNHSVPLCMSNKNKENWTKEEVKFNADRLEYYLERNGMDPSIERIPKSEITPAMSKITMKKGPSKNNPNLNPNEEDVSNLKSACKYAIMMATFMHTYVNEHQYEDIGEVLYCSLGLRYGDTTEGIFRPENDYSISPDLTRSTQMMWFSNLLSRTEYGFIMDNDEKDINPLFVSLLKAKKEEFLTLGVRIEDIESRTNI